jgi:5'-nucleotidase
MALTRFAAAVVLATLSAPAAALNVLLSNDDGLSSNLRALYAALKADGHDVIVSVPCTGQSGRGAAVAMYSTTLIVPDNDKTQIDAERGCHNGAAALGAPAVGPFTKQGYTQGDYHYVHGTPVMAVMYGLDVLAPARWRRAPDLVLSGPNEGRNVGRLVISSGTVGNAQFAAARGLPAIALSAGTDTVDNTHLANPYSAVVGQLALKLVKALRASAGAGPLLPVGMALNVNFPDAPKATLPWALTRQGSFELYDLRFNASPPYGMKLSVSAPRAATPEQRNDEAWVSASRISITPMQVGYEHASAARQLLQSRLGELVSR